MSPEAVTGATAIGIVIIDRLPEVLRIIAADRRDKRKAKEAAK